jgi:recombination protein RecT
MSKPNELLEKVVAKANGEAGKPLTYGDQVKLYLSKPEVLSEIRTALPKHITAERLARIALTTIRTTPKLLECSLSSLMAAIMQSAQLGLEPGLLGHCYFVPFRNNKTCQSEVQFIIGYKGLIDLARRSGDIVTIAAGAIYSNDKFLYRKGYEEILEHEPNFQNRGELIGVYAYATTKDGGRYGDVMTLEDVNRIKSRSKAKEFGPWVTDFEEMAKKTVLRRLAKYLPLSIEINTKILEDEQKEFSDATEIAVNMPEPLALGGVYQAVTPAIVEGVGGFEEGSSDV